GERLARRLAPMRRGSGLVERIDRDWAEDAELHRERLLERSAALGLLDVLGEGRPVQGDAGAFRLGRGRLCLCTADRAHSTFAAREALRRLGQKGDGALAADRAVITMRRRDAETRCQQLLRVAIAPAQEAHDIERADLAEEFCAAVGLRATQRLLQ